MFSNILLIGGVRGLYVTMNGMAGLGSVVGVFVECRRSILSLLAALRMADSMSAVGYPRFLRFILRFLQASWNRSGVLQILFIRIAWL